MLEYKYYNLKSRIFVHTLNIKMIVSRKGPLWLKNIRSCNMQLQGPYNHSRFLANDFTTINEKLDESNGSKNYEETITNNDQSVKDTSTPLYPGHIPTSIFQKGTVILLGYQLQNHYKFTN